MTKEIYYLSQIASVTGLTEERIHQWIHRGYFMPSHAPKNGCVRKFTFQEVLFVAVLFELTKIGVSIFSAVEMVWRVVPAPPGGDFVYLDFGIIRINFGISTLKKKIAAALESTPRPARLPRGQNRRLRHVQKEAA